MSDFQPLTPPILPLGLPGAPRDTRIVVAMSGGVDSSVAAALVHQLGYDTVGVTLQLYDHGAAVSRKGACCAGQDIHDARFVAEKIGIPHYVLDYESRFRNSVIDEFASSYLAGETPVPCITCNQTVKFTDLLQVARELGAQALVTGHYVRRIMGRQGAELHSAADPARDQSYFLFATTRAQLDFLRFPLGDLQKDETRAIAGRLGLPVADKPDSQDICFVPQGRYADVITKLRPEAAVPGDIVHLDGRVLARHQGIIHYTVGQRRGLGVSGGEPLFVLRLEAASQRVIVGPREALLKSRLRLRGMNWLGDDAPSGQGREVLVKVRSTRPPVAGILMSDATGGAQIKLHEPEEAIAPGQAGVVYDAENASRVLGGGWIMRDAQTPAQTPAMAEAPVFQ
ncbi:MAG: tRNA-uridine 2-sulfurtransferase [Alphaproteobacteria bacterium]|nr:tRNA-uridine 2-sulfurtransferase [Alphaproteobacteria bacterium]